MKHLLKFTIVAALAFTTPIIGSGFAQMGDMKMGSMGKSMGALE